MGPSPPESFDPYRPPASLSPQADPVSRFGPPPRPREPRLRYLVLFLLTCVTTTLAGVGFSVGLGENPAEVSITGLLPRALWYSGGVLVILGAHEFGHYFACRYYGVWASLPYFLPFPLGFGTLGAVIRIRQPIATKRQFFDIGIAGPIAGFLALIPILVFAMSASTVVRLPADFQGAEFGEPLLFRLVARLFFDPIPANHSIDLHPAGWAAWLGMLATALNLVPIGQLDGGHISYAVFGRRSSAITIGLTLMLAAVLIGSILVMVLGHMAWTAGYLAWTVIVLAMVLMLGPHHPRTYDESEPLDHPRLLLAVFAAAMFVLCFTPVPIRIVG